MAWLVKVLRQVSRQVLRDDPHMLNVMLGLVLIGALGFGWVRYQTLPADERSLFNRRAGAGASFVLALILAVTGHIFWAVPLAAFGYLIMWRRRPANSFGRAGFGGRMASVRTAFLAMTLDQASGALTGHVLAGSLAGRDLASLSRAELAMLWRECRAGESQSRQLLEAYLDRRWPEWRAEMPRASADGQGRGGPAGGTAGTDSTEQPTGDRRRMPMTRQEAFDVLGLGSNAGLEDIKAAHRNLMKRLHPDQGGTNYLAAKINEAKDVLTGKRA